MTSKEKVEIAAPILIETWALAAFSRMRPEGWPTIRRPGQDAARLSQADESIARYLSQLDSADRQEVLMSGATA